MGKTSFESSYLFIFIISDMQMANIFNKKSIINKQNTDIFVVVTEFLFWYCFLRLISFIYVCPQHK